MAEGQGISLPALSATQRAVDRGQSQGIRVRRIRTDFRSCRPVEASGETPLGSAEGAGTVGMSGDGSVDGHPCLAARAPPPWPFQVQLWALAEVRNLMQE